MFAFSYLIMRRQKVSRPQIAFDALITASWTFVKIFAITFNSRTYNRIENDRVHLTIPLTSDVLQIRQLTHRSTVTKTGSGVTEQPKGGGCACGAIRY